MIFWGLSQYEFLSFVTIRVFEFCHILSFFKFCHNLSFWVLSQFEFLTLVTISVFDFCQNLIFWFLSQLEFWWHFRFFNISVLMMFQFWWHLSYCKILVLGTFQCWWRFSFDLDPPNVTRLIKFVCLTQFFEPIFFDLSIWTCLFWVLSKYEFLSFITIGVLVTIIF